jgi:isopentenyl-diphosphate Delta-isomerase
MEQRKEKHLSICTDPSRFQVEGAGAGFDAIKLLHVALPEMAEAEVDTSVQFLGRRVSLPFLISCMTGGSEGGFKANALMAEAAQALGIPVGVGSIRVLLSRPELFEHFHIKPIARDVPVLANIGAVQARDNPQRILDLAVRLEAQALVVHLNPGQELFQPEGDRDFRGLKEGIARLCDRSPLPIIVKETGFGILPDLARELLDAGAAYVDLAGSGGTNWISVESYRLPEEEREAAREFSEWGIPTSVLLADLGRAGGRVIASGGIRSGMDAAKALAMGASLCGFALPVIRAVTESGVPAVTGLFRRLEKTLRAAMLLTGSRTISDLQRGVVWRDPVFAMRVESFHHAAVTGAAAGVDGGGER